MISRIINSKERESALIEHVRSMPANLLREYLADLLTDAAPQQIDHFVIVLRAQDAVPRKLTVELDEGAA